MDLDRTELPALRIARYVLWSLIASNWVFGAGVLLLLIATFVVPDWTLAALRSTHLIENASWMTAWSAILVLLLVTVWLTRVVLTRLLAMLQTVRMREPFVPANAQRLETIAWALLARQLVLIVLNIGSSAISAQAQPLSVDIASSINGWFIVLLAFILARLFAQAAAMREELEGTV